jgi:glycerophosphoryl diester phosphodiesterase
MNLSDIKKLDAGSWFDSKFRNEKIPLLEELIEMVKGRAYLNIEVKSRQNARIENNVDKILDVIYKAGFEKHTLFSSFDYKLLGLIRKLNPELHTAAIKLPMHRTLPSEITLEFGCEAYVCSIKEINKRISDNTKKHNIYVGVYSVDNEKQLEKVMKYNVKALVTNYPEKLRKLLNF